MFMSIFRKAVRFEKELTSHFSPSQRNHKAVKQVVVCRLHFSWWGFRRRKFVFEIGGEMWIMR